MFKAIFSAVLAAVGRKEPELKAVSLPVNKKLKERLAMFLVVAQGMGRREQDVLDQLSLVMGRPISRPDLVLEQVTISYLGPFPIPSTDPRKEFWRVMSEWFDEISELHWSAEETLLELGRLASLSELPPNHPLSCIFNN